MSYARSRFAAAAKLVTAVALAGGVGVAQAELLAFYQFDGNASDSSGNERNATFVSATLDTGYQGQSYRFNGSSDYIRVPVDINPTVLPQLTMGAWVQLDRPTAPSNFAGTQTFISHDDGGFDRSLVQDSRGGGGINSFSAFTGSGSILRGSPIVTSAWVFMAARYDQTAGTVKLNVGTDVFSANNTQSGGGLLFTDIGNNPSFRSFMQGKIDNVFFFNTVLSDQQIEAIRVGGASAILAVPEPGTWVLLASGLIAIAIAIAKQRGAGKDAAFSVDDRVGWSGMPPD